MKKVLLTAAALTMIGSAANATTTAYTDAQAAYDALTGSTGAYGMYGATMSSGTQGSWNTFLDQASDIFTPGLPIFETIMIGGVPVRIQTGVGPATGTHSVNTIVGSAVSASERTAEDFVGTGTTLDASSHIGMSVDAIVAAGTAYATAASGDDADAASVAAAAANFSTVYTRERAKIDAAHTGLGNLAATFASSNLTRSEIADYSVSLSQTTLGTVTPTVPLAYTNRLSNLAGSFNTQVETGGSFSEMADVRIPAGWSTYDVTDSDGTHYEIVLNTGASNSAPQITISIPDSVTTAAGRTAAIKAHLNSL